MNKKLDISVPATIKDCSPQQLAKWLQLCSGKMDLNSLVGKLDFRVQVVSIFSGISKSRLENCSAIQINEPFAHLISMLNYQPKEPTGELVIDGVKYVFDKTFEHKSAGQIIDLKLIESVYANPIKVMAILYVEDGFVYNDTDENERVLNPLRKRIEVFDKNFPGDEFLDVFAFFLTNYEELKTAIFILKTAMSQAITEKTMNELKTELSGIRNGSTGQQT